MNNDIEIRKIGKETLHQQLEVYGSAFHSSKSHEENYERWEKKHYKNPLGNSLVFGAYMEGNLVGMNSYMPVEYNYNGRVIPMLQSCESGVMTGFQGKGIWSKVVRYAIDYIFKETNYEAVIGFPNYKNSYPGFKKMGWDTLVEMSNYVMVNNTGSFSMAMFKGKRFLQILGKLIVLQRLGVYSIGCGYRKYSIGACRFDDLLWDNKSDVLSVSHNEELLEWKVSYKSIKTLAIKKGDDILATCIYSLGEYNGASIIKLEKCVVGNDASISLKKAIALFCGYFAKEYRDVAFVRVWSMPNTSLSSALKKIFFMKSSHPNPFIIKQKEGEFSNKVWNLSFFDLD